MTITKEKQAEHLLEIAQNYEDGEPCFLYVDRKTGILDSCPGKFQATWGHNQLITEIIDTKDELYHARDCGIEDMIETHNLEDCEYAPIIDPNILNILRYKMQVTLLNCSIITAPGKYEMKEISFSDVKEIINTCPVISAIGHIATAEILSSLSEKKIEVNRIKYVQQPGDVAIVFKLKERILEGKILNIEEIKEIEYDFYILSRNN